MLKLAAALGLPLVAVWLLSVSDEPSVPPQQRPSAQTIQAARDAVHQIRQAQGSGSSNKEVRFDNRVLQGLATLASDASGFTRLGASISAGTFSAEVSVPLLENQWLNASATITGEHQGFPELHLRAGSLKLHPLIGRWLAEAAHWLLQARGVQLPPLDQMVQRVVVNQEELVAELDLPQGTGIVGGVIGARGAEIDSNVLSQVYCRLSELQREKPSSELSLQVQRAFSAAPSSNAERYNRAALVALALFVVGETAEALVPSSLAPLKACKKPSTAVLLSNRADLAKHWTLSAALAAVLGNDAATALGEWKELSDSLPSGSGFSFMDLAADRSGLHMARRATDPRSARETAAELSRVTEEQIFPISLMAAQEGLSEQQFIARYGSIDATRYEMTVQWIDRELDRVQSR